MIPKIIHYCWVGGAPKPKSVLYCIESWKKFCPDYEIREWNETNYDFTKNEYMRQAYEAKKWGFVPDYARLDIVYQHGGIYLDTDVEIIRSFDSLLDHEGFFGFEDTGEGSYFVACGLGFGAEKHNTLIKRLRDYYDSVQFYHPDGTLNLTPAPRHNTPIFIEHGVLSNNSIQRIGGNVFYPSEYFCPKVFKTGKTRITKNTYSIHHFSASWLDEAVRQEITHVQSVCQNFGCKLGYFILWVESVWKKYGLVGITKRSIIRIYEYFYSYWPLIRAIVKKLLKKQKQKQGVVIFDTGMYTLNTGDCIIMENCMRHLNLIIDLSDTIHISTHKVPTSENKCDRKYKFVCGTNILSCNMRHYGLWKLPRNIDDYHGITLMGVGFDSLNTKFDFYSKLLFQYMLSSKGIHSVRDSFSERQLKLMGINNVINTGCPTMWHLTPDFCEKIPVKKGKKVVCTITDYCRVPEKDKLMIDILSKLYTEVYFWIQGQDDYQYLKELSAENKVTIIQSTLREYDEILKQQNLDYVGTRLHAGIRAISSGKRSIVIAIDNRARCIARDTGLKIVERSDIEDNLEKLILSDFVTEINMPWDNIEKWKNQFS